MIKSKERVEFNLSNILDTPSIGGVYAFWTKPWTKPAVGVEYVPIYVGKTKDMHRRMKEHRDTRKGSTKKRTSLYSYFTARIPLFFCYYPTTTSRMDRMERRLIKRWKPNANDQIPGY